MIIKVRHTVQMGHRLWKLGGMCQNIHGHTWTVILSIEGEPDLSGIVIDFHDVKKKWRHYLDQDFDHRMVFDNADPILPQTSGERLRWYPGSVLTNFQPTVENMASYWASVAKAIFGPHFRYTVELWEGDNNCAVASVE